MCFRNKDISYSFPVIFDWSRCKVRSCRASPGSCCSQHFDDKDCSLRPPVTPSEDCAGQPQRSQGGQRTFWPQRFALWSSCGTRKRSVDGSGEFLGISHWRQSFDPEPWASPKSIFYLQGNLGKYPETRKVKALILRTYKECNTKPRRPQFRGWLNSF